MRAVRTLTRTLLAFAVVSGFATANAAETTIETLNKDEDGRFVYSPQLVRIKPGATVTFVATDNGHDAVSVDGMLPAGAQPIKVPLNKDGSFTLTEPGVYGVQCTPHAGLGMVAVIVVGEPTNLKAVKAAVSKLPPKAKERMQALLSQVS